MILGLIVNSTYTICFIADISDAIYLVSIFVDECESIVNVNKNIVIGQGI